MTTDQIDFIALYRELGVEADCSLDDLRLVYRRRVADLHPDRIGASGEDELKSLNLRYAAVLEFHRHYGRLPGAAPVPGGRRHDNPVEPPQLPPQSPPQSAADAVPAETGTRKPSKFVVYGVMSLAVLLVWWFSRTGAGSAAFHGYGIAGNERESTPRSAISLRRDMSREQVVALLGHPDLREHGDTHWSYGSSWVGFDCAGVIDWYSSPLDPLKASSSRPPVAMHAVAGATRCPSGGVPSNSHWQAP